MSQIEVNKINPATSTTVTLGDSGDTFNIVSGATLDINSGATIDATGATITGFGGASDEQVKVSSDDTTAGFLNGKLTAGTSITLTEGSGGGDETLAIAYSTPATLPAASGVNLTALNATQLTSGKVPTAQLGTGTASSSTILYGDQTYKTEPSSGTSWQSVETGATMTAVAGNGYPINTTSNACTVTLPAGSVGDTVELVDYAGTWDTNNVTLAPNGSENLKGANNDLILSKERLGVRVVYVDATQGWVAATAANEGTQAISPPPADIEWLVIAGGGGGAGNYYHGGGGAGGYRTNFGGTKLTLTEGNVYTATIGAGGNSNNTANGSPGVDSSLAGTGITTITSTGGGYGGAAANGGDGGSGGGGGGTSKVGGSGNTPSTSPSQGNDGGDAGQGGGGGGGTGGAGGTGGGSNGGSGGAGVNNSITGAAVGYAGGGGGGAWNGTIGVATHGGGNGGQDVGAGGCIAASDATNGTGGGGGGSCGYNHCSGYLIGGAGGDGIVIIRIATAAYSGTTSGSPTITTDGTDTVIKFLSTGTYTA